MSDNGHSVDISAADQFGLGLVADGSDLFDLGHLPGADVSDAKPAWAMEPDLPGHAGLASDPIALEFGSHDGQPAGAHPAYLQVAGLDQAPLIFPLQHADATAPAGQMPHDHVPAGQNHIAVNHAPDHATADHAVVHGPSLSLADILADAADDLASFHTAAGGTAGGGHAPMGSGLFTPFHPVEALGGFTELNVIDHTILNGHGH